MFIMSLNPTVKFKRVTKKFFDPSGDGEINAIENLTFTLHERSFLFLTGASGAGKTTLIRMLYAELFPTDGELIVCGRNISKIKEKHIPLLRRQVGVIHQSFHLIERKSAVDNVALALLIKGVGRKKAIKRAEELLEMVRLTDRKNHPVITMADGEKQRVALARALAVEPQLVVADEPTGNLDPQLSDEVFAILESMLKRGCSVIVATHDSRRVESSEHSVIYLDKGRIKAVRGDVEAEIQ